MTLSSPALREEDERIKREAEERIKREAEERIKREAEEKEKEDERMSDYWKRYDEARLRVDEARIKRKAEEKERYDELKFQDKEDNGTDKGLHFWGLWGEDRLERIKRKAEWRRQRNLIKTENSLKEELRKRYAVFSFIPEMEELKSFIHWTKETEETFYKKWRKEWRRWAVRNHPDKTKKVDPILFNKYSAATNDIVDFRKQLRELREQRKKINKENRKHPI